MTAPYGASPATWLHWDVMLGLGADLLPVVCQPSLTISPTSKLVAYGKVPSRFDRDGRVVGFPKWTSYHATDADLAAWSSDNRLGICLQTRRIRALDVDIEDFDAAQTVREALDAWAAGKGLRFTYRVRSNSAKFLTLFELSGDYGKQVLHTKDGAIELLMSGQQCVVAGAHPSGARYEWEGGEPTSIPVLTPDLFELLKRTVRVDCEEGWTEGRAPKARDRGSATGVSDPVSEYLLEARREFVVSDHADRLDVVCPWASEHTSPSDASSTSYFKAGTGSFEQGAFHCLHSHCSGRLLGDFLAAIGYASAGFEDLSDGTEASVQAFVSEDDFIGDRAVPLSPVAGPRFIRSETHIKVLIKNVVEALRHPEWCGLLVRFDTFQHVVMIGPPGDCRKIRDTDSTRLNIRLSEKGFGPGAISNEMIERALTFAAHEREYDSAIDWLRGLPEWDGVPRVEQFCARYLGAEDTPYHRAVSRYWWTAHAGRVLVPSGVQADAAIILVSGQGTGKTTTIKHLVPLPEHRGEIHLNAKRYDIIRELRGRLVIELAELQGLKSRDADSIKALISATDDTLVDKYEKHAQDLVRRCVFVGSSNNDDFLSDPTGNRRFLPVYVGEAQALSLIKRDRDQLWAEATGLFEQLGEVDWREAQRLVLAEHSKFEEIDVWEERVFEWLDDTLNWSSEVAGGQFVTCGRVLHAALHMDTQRQSARDMHRIGRIFVRYGLVKRNHRVAGHQTKVWVRKETKHLEAAAPLP